MFPEVRMLQRQRLEINALASQHPSALLTLQCNQTSVTKPLHQKQIHHNKSSLDEIPIVVKLQRMMLFPMFCRVLPSAEVDPKQLQSLHSHSSALKLYMMILCLFSGIWMATPALDSAHLSNLLFLASFSPSFFSSSLNIHLSPPPASLSPPQCLSVLSAEVPYTAVVG